MTEKKQRPKADIDTLAALISTHAPYDGSFELRLPGIHATRVSQPFQRFEDVRLLFAPTIGNSVEFRVSTT